MPKSQSEMFPRGSRIAPDWKPDAEDVQYAKGKGFSESQIARIAEDFHDYWLAKPGKDAIKLDWRATWRTWVRRSADKMKPAQSRSINNDAQRAKWDA